MYDTLDPTAAERVRFLHHHVHEVLYGAPPADHDPALDNDDEPPAATGQPLRPEYDPSRPFMERIDAKVSELAAAGTPLSGRTLRGHVYAYRDQGVAGLVDGRTTREPRPGGRVDPRVISLIEAELAKQTDASTGTKGRVITHVTLRPPRPDSPSPHARPCTGPSPTSNAAATRSGTPPPAAASRTGPTARSAAGSRPGPASSWRSTPPRST